MRILRLELFGFKSFKDKTIVTFDQPVTAIVGSNGCGKSNVVDALYWVMGDMSPKHLRGTHMSDVIFSGTKTHQALDMAEVSLVMERNPDTDPELPPQFQASREIQVTRRYYRSGDTEYFINKVPCRLRDIQEFFMDTGVGAKAYSIIEQGAIGRMVSQKPEERRLIIEEVAGIMKFKARKAETLRKIEASKTNLNRVDDIVKDLQKQLGSLKRQADKAEKYKKFSEELRSLEIRLAGQEWLQRRDAKTEAERVALELQRAIEALGDKLSQERQRLEEAEAQLSTLEIELTERRDQSRQSELAQKDTEAQIAGLESRHEASAHRQESDQEALREIESRASTLEAELAELATRIETLQNDAREKAALIEQATEGLGQLREQSQQLRGRLEENRKKLHSEELEQTRLTQEIQGLQKQHGQLHAKQDSLKLQITEVESKLELHGAEMNSTLSSLEKAFSTRSDLEAEKNDVFDRLGTLEGRRGELQGRRDEIKEKMSSARIRREHLQTLERDMEGVDASARTLAQALREQGSERKLLADYIQVPTLLEKAVEAALGRNLQRLRADNLSEVDALAAILSNSQDAEARRGRAPLWIPSMAASNSGTPSLDAIFLSANAATPDNEAPPYLSAPQEIPGPDGMVSYVTPVVQTATQLPRLQTAKEFLLNHPDVVGPLAQLVSNETESEKNQAWLGLVRDTWVLRDRRAFSEITAQLAGVPLDFVTLDGDVLTREGLLDLAPVQQDAAGEGSSLVARKREITELGTQLEQLDLALAAAQAELDACIREHSETKERFRELTARLAALDPDVERHSVFLRQVEAQIARLQEKRELQSAELLRAQTEAAEASHRLQATTHKLSEAEGRKNLAQDDFQAADSELKLALAEQSAREQSLNELQSAAKKTDRELAELQSQRAASEQEKTLSAARREQLTQDISNLNAILAELEAELGELRTQHGEQSVKAQEARALEAQAQSQVDARKGEAKELQRQAEQLASEFQGLSSRLKDMEQSVAVNEVEIRNLCERIQQTYQLDLGTLPEDELKALMAPGDLEEMADPEAGKERAKQLRHKIDNLGKINMVAAEEFDTLSRQHEYLYVQRQDLNDSINQLQAAIDRINRESKERFAASFNAVNEAFQRTFPVMFGGGSAELRLTNPDDLLESGVEIVAQPPGKKLQSVTLLSGGEKALTAVSLIFGIFSIKPSPFCVLDEVDAPLDDANVGRFNTHVRKMAELSQVIMITHNKTSMEHVDAIFGVTMQDPGVSKVASAKIDEMML